MSSITTKTTYISTKPRHQTTDRMCFSEPRGKYYHHETHVPVRRHGHGHHHSHHSHHHHSGSRSSVPVYVTHSPRVSTSSYRPAVVAPVMYETRTSTTRYRS
ncbi:hypothetical protein MN608_04530 [Microdochium nivale]|nr:hypothetical protein MN608_04530 [Microdochium nivale]